MSKPSDAHSWSAVKLKAWNQREKNPNTYYYRFNEPGQPQKSGPWSEDEKRAFLERLEEMGGKAMHNWGIFSKTIVGRVGYQCAAFYRKLVKDGEIIDEHYHFDEKGRLLKPNSIVEKKNKFNNNNNNSPECRNDFVQCYYKGNSPVNDDSVNNNENPAYPSSFHDPLEKMVAMDGYHMAYDQDVSRCRPKRSLSIPDKDYSKSPKRHQISDNEMLQHHNAMNLEDIGKPDFNSNYLLNSQNSLNNAAYHIVLPNSTIGAVYLSSSQCASDWNWIFSHKIKSVVNCTLDVPNYFEDPAYDIQYLRVSSFDGKTVDETISSLEVSSFWIYQQVSKGNTVLVHDNEDFKSSLVIFGYLIQFHSMALQDAILLFQKIGIPSFMIKPNLASALSRIEQTVINKKSKSEPMDLKQNYNQIANGVELNEYNCMNEFNSEFESSDSIMNMNLDSELNLWDPLEKLETYPKIANVHYYDDLHYASMDHQLTTFDTFDSLLNFYA